jgi:hypothetical protein
VTILKSREQHVATMMSLYQERAVLCRQAGEMAIKSSSTSTGFPGLGLAGPDDNSNMGVLMRHGYLYCARNMVALHRVLELVKVRLTTPGQETFPFVASSRNLKLLIQC